MERIRDPGPDAPAVQMAGVTKRFPGVTANDRIDFTVRRGEVHALLGENGAGKTTLMNILYGLYRPDEGVVRIGGRETAFSGPRDAIAAGIGMVHQHFMLIPVMTVAENVIIGSEPAGFLGRIDRKAAARAVLELSSRFGLELDPEARVGDLPVGARQRVEIVKALYRQAEVLILDEPTAVLTPEESSALFRTLAGLAEAGRSIIFITHKLGEVMSAAHRITVLRGGRVAGACAPEETSEAELAALMVGREVDTRPSRPPVEKGPVVLEVTDLRASGLRGGPAVRGVSFSVRGGEVFGIVGVQGNGQTELVEAIAGLRRPSGGRVRIEGRIVTNLPAGRRGLEVAHVPEDRHARGLVESYSIADNLVLNLYKKAPFSRWGVIRPRAIEKNALKLMKAYDVRAPGPDTTAGALSGGNQQRLVAARELERPAALVIAAQPTRGLDVGSAAFIHERILEKRAEGRAVLLVSTELDEVLALADRIGVMYKGRLAAIVEADQARREKIGLYMAGLEAGGGV